MSFKTSLIAALAAIVSSAQAAGFASQANEPYPLDYWAVRDQMSNVNVSPDGRYVAFLKIDSREGNPIIEVYETANLGAEPYRAGGESLEVTGVNWVGDTELIVSFRGQVSDRIDGFNRGAYRNRLALLDVEEEKFTPLDSSGTGGRNATQFNMTFVSVLPNDPDRILIRYAEGNARSNEAGFFRLNLDTRGRSLVMRDDRDVFSEQFDADGNPRGGARFDEDTDEFVYLYRSVGERSWREIYRVSEESFENFQIESLVPGSEDLLYVTANNGNDKQGLWTFDANTGQFVDLVFRTPDADMTGVARHSNSWAMPNYPIAASYFTDHPHREYFDNEESLIEEATIRQLEGLIPNADIVRIQSRSRDGSTMIITNRGARDPGSFYLLAGGRLQYLGGRKPLLEAENLADVEFIRYPARDGRVIPAYLTVPNGEGPFPLIVLPHGGPFVHETIVFDEWAQLLANNGYMVLQPQYRGSQGYGLDHYTSAFITGGRGGYEMQDDKDDGALYLVQQGRVDPDRMAFFGWSYGGYAALLAASRDQNIYQCSIAGAAVTDNNLQVNFYRNRIRGSQRTEQLRFWDDSINPIEIADQVNIPLLIVHGSIDQRVPPLHATRYRRALDSAGVDYQFLELDGADHFLSTLFYPHKIEFYEAMISFLQNDCGPGGL